MAIRQDAIRRHLANDNDRLRAALRLIVEMCAGQPDNEMTCHVARIARVALVSAAPENEALRNPAQPTEGEPA
ncbi:hypothetical protein [Caballeronia sp. ATUFL_F1_KS39]|uniref:hypothetical protein n=1 Tax=Caballeronia sp. ATUFL_F1_KS39 TaxID=2921766 RepID=UPI00202860E1|nr:hypothetical protein [Caballeronia sp. ATUFL_F1_KS39]